MSMLRYVKNVPSFSFRDGRSWNLPMSVMGQFQAGGQDSGIAAGTDHPGELLWLGKEL